MSDILKIFEEFYSEDKIAVEVISRTQKKNTFAHAYIFSGKNLEKVNHFVKIFSKLLLCDNKTGVDKCINCKIFEDGQHPDFRIWGLEDEKSKNIKVDQIRELISESLKYPITAKQKVLIVENAGKLADVGANAVLKTLEEPSKTTTIILTVDSIDNILPTIISRCQIIPISGGFVEGEKIVNLDEFIPKSYLEAHDIAEKYASLEVKELVQLLKNIQKQLWDNSKYSLFTEHDLSKKIILFENIEKYISSLTGYVKPKLILENFFVDLFEYNK